RELSQSTHIEFKSLGKSKFGISDNLGKSNSNFFLRMFRKFFGKFFAFPQIEFIWLVKRKLEAENHIDLLITVAHPHAIHWAIPFVRKSNFQHWIADCGDPFMGDPLNFRAFYFKFLE